MMTHTDEMREAARKAYAEKQRTMVYKTPREALDGWGRRATDTEVVLWLEDLQARSCRELNADDSYTLASARAVIERLTKELQQRDVFLDQRIEYLSHKIQRTRQDTFLNEDLRAKRDELTVIQTTSKRIQEHLKKKQ